MYTSPQPSDVDPRFDYPECIESRSWQQIADNYRATPWLFKTGGLGSSATPDVKVWACFQNHPCMPKLVDPSSETYYTDAVCYKFHEGHKAWVPWGLHSEIQHFRCNNPLSAVAATTR
jgi:hypothetical protein